MIFLRIVCFFFIFQLYFPATKSELYSNKFLMKAEVTTDEAKLIAEKYGFIFHKQVIPGYFVLKRVDVTDKTTSRSKWKSDTMRKDYPQIKSIKQERYPETTAHTVETEPKTTTEFSVTDPYWKNMWHLHPNREPNMGVYKAWSRGYNGKGVTLAIIDSGIDQSQTDLQQNYVAELAYDYLDDDDNPLMNYTAGESSHGTKCAGIAVAEKNNNQCIVGIAHEARFTNLRTFGAITSTTYSDTALAFIHHTDDIAIYSNSWGITDRGQGFPESQSVITDAFKVGVYNGRRGKGVIYTFSSGNGGVFRDCNLDIYNSNIYTISVNSVAFDGSPADYAETCTAVMISAFGGSFDSGARITTTDSNNDCTTTFSGTSAACPMVTGIIALALQANPELTWRDIQHLIVETATTSGLKNGAFVTNGSGKNVSLFFGFGLINADTMISRALSWKTVPPLHRHTSAIVHVNRASYVYNIQSTKFIRSNITHIEQVMVWMKFRTSKYKSVSFNLASPSGTENRILRRRVYNSYKNTTWSSLTVHCWGENPNGAWKLNMSSTGTAYLYEWRLYIYGTLTDPLLNNPKDISNGYIGSHCYGTSCWQPHSVCDNKTKICVCEDGYSQNTDLCIKEGDIGAVCERTQDCTQENSNCNNTTGTCDCHSGYRTLAGNCIKDGDYGGRCLLNGTCTDDDIACNTFLETCVKCPSNFRKIDNQCMKDGSVGGKCLSNSSCSSDDAFCERSSNMCVTCLRYYYSVKDGKCVKDGSLGGNCRWLYKCNTPEIFCNSSSDRCVCRSGYNETTGLCNMDGIVGGKCLSNSRCIDDDAFCDSSNNICVYCWRYSSTVIDGKCVRDGSLGGACNYFSKCYARGTYCNSSSNKCECRSGYNESTGSCSLDGFVGGNCLSNSSCFGDSTVCNISSNTCVSCQYSFTVIDGECVEDGTLGGFCQSNYYSSCTPSHSRCNLLTHKCECRSGYNEVNGSCRVGDGYVGGRCSLNDTCFGYNTACDRSKNICVSCPYYHSKINGKCVRDGSLGGYCSIYVSCSSLRTRCNNSTNICECTSSFNQSSGSCSTDGYIGGKCSSGGTCFTANSICESSNFTCISCRKGYSEVDGKCVRDQYLGGYCLYRCRQRNTYCSYRSRSRCECLKGYRESSGNCIKDGGLGGYCRYSCLSQRTFCNRDTNRCECKQGYNASGRTCIRSNDGRPGGQCLSDGTCISHKSVCNTYNNTCVKCPLYHHWIHDQCLRDGIAGGKCLYNRWCIGSDTVCTKNNNTCMKCPEDLRVLEDKCVRVELNQTSAEVNTTCDERTKHCVKNTNNNDKGDKTLVDLVALNRTGAEVNTTCDERIKTCEKNTNNYDEVNKTLVDLVELNQTGAEVNTTCDERTKTCVKNTNNYDKVDKALVDLGSSELQAIIVFAVVIVLAVAVILCDRIFHRQTRLQHNRPVQV